MKHKLSILILLAVSSTSFQSGAVTTAVETSKQRLAKKAPKQGDFTDATQAAKQKRVDLKVNPSEPVGATRPLIQSKKTAPLAAATTVATAVEDSPKIKAPTLGDFTFHFTSKNTMTFGRKAELEEIGGKNYGLTNELLVSAIHSSGWGIELSGAYGSSSNADSSKDKSARKDASVLLYHPSLFKNDSVNLFGKFRAYVPTSEGSQARGATQYRYYSMLAIDLSKRLSVFNLAMPMWFSQNDKKPESSPFNLYDCTELSHQTTKSIALAIGQQTNIETHYGTATGKSVELYPFMDITIIPNVLIEPKIYLPVFVSEIVDGPKNASIDQTQFELFVKIAI